MSGEDLLETSLANQLRALADRLPEGAKQRGLRAAAQELDEKYQTWQNSPASLGHYYGRNYLESAADARKLLSEQ